MSVKTKPYLFALLCMAGTSAFAAEVTDTFQFFSGEKYQLRAVDVFRMGKAYPEMQLSTKLRPLYKEAFFSEAEFRTALEKALGHRFTYAHFTELAEKSCDEAQKLVVKAYSNNMIQLVYQSAGDIQLPEPSEFITVEHQLSQGDLHIGSSSFSTTDLKANVDSRTLCVDVKTQHSEPLAVICPDQSDGLTVRAGQSYRLNGLGQEFQNPGVIDGSWNGKVRHSGNKMEAFNGGATGNTQFPVLYATNPDKPDFALYLDNVSSATWNFKQQPWHIEPADGKRSLFLFTADDLPELRHTYMGMVGKPLVPPRKMFGMWLSEYGFDNWQELDDKLHTLKQHHFPVDGVVMDLQWFGNVSSADPMSQMGSLTWDRKNFPQPEKKVASLKEQGIGMVLIEESYVSEGLKSFQVMGDAGYLAKDPDTGKPIDTDSTGIGHWWGKGGMIDWTNPEAAKYWHDWKRAPLIDMGVMGHWTDLGEPEIYNGKGIYYQDKTHPEVHNIYNYRWIESIYNGYQARGTKQRPFMMTRSGGPGIQKFGASMWSADIGSNLDSLAVHAGMQENMMLSGMDYYGSDIGGFHRSGLGVIGKEKTKALDETYTQWFAYSSLLDVPVRPHTENLCNCKETAPDRIGETDSNRYNLERRYQLIPYMYSLAHLAHNNGAPVFPSLSYEYPKDTQAVRADHKMIGSDLLTVAVAHLWQTSTDVYLPAGTWFDYTSNQVYNGEKGRVVTGYPLRRELDGEQVYTLPLFAREGAIIPYNPQEKALSSEVPETLALKVFGLAKQGEFTLYEDDGKTTAYLNGAVRKTHITTQVNTQSANLLISSAGDYAGASESRGLHIEWLMPDRAIAKVTLNGSVVSQWDYNDNLLVIDAGPFQVSENQRVEVQFR